MSKIKRGRVIAVWLMIALIFGVILIVGRSLMPAKVVATLENYEPWETQVVEAFSQLPMQEGGRIKLFESWANQQMLSFSGKRKSKVSNGEGEEITVRPTEWMLDIHFRPELAKQFPSFRVENAEVLEMVGLDHKKARDYYSYNELEAKLDRISELKKELEELQKNPEIELNTVQKQALALSGNLAWFESYLSYFDFAKLRADNEKSGLAWSSIILTAPKIRAAINQRAPNAPLGREELLIGRLVQEASNAARYGWPVMPPTQEGQEAWETAGARLWEVFTTGKNDLVQTSKIFNQLEEIYLHRDASGEKLVPLIKAYHDTLNKEQTVAAKASNLSAEKSYLKGQWFYRALGYCFIPGTLLVVLSWLSPATRWSRVLNLVTWGLSGIGLILCVTGIILRMVITERPPVGNLFETIPFITAAIVLIALLMELMTRRGLAIGLAPIAGFAGLVLARLYELEEGGDSLEPLRAVLASNFWLTYHVLTITLGYAAGILAGFIGIAYLGNRHLGIAEDDPKILRSLTRMNYGVICFTLLLSLIGTILGGIWANDSWGRFWGWDPKENGALMIVLWNLIILHSRIGGAIKEWGFHMLSVAGMAVVVFSWWHVNMLGTGLHSYGFTEGAHIIWFFYGLIGLVLLLSSYAKMLEKK